MSDNFWKLIVRFRDFGYEMYLKQREAGNHPADYKTKFLSFLSGYYIFVLFFTSQTALAIFDLKSPAWMDWNAAYVKIALAIVIGYLPLRWLRNYLLKQVEHIPLPKEVNRKKYTANLMVYIACFILGHVLWISVGLVKISLSNS